MFLFNNISLYIYGTITLCFFLEKLINIFVSNSSSKWYLIHALINTLITYLVIPDCINFLKDPLSGLESSYSDIPLSLTVGLHLFHCIKYYKKLTIIDWVHHFVSNIFSCCIIFPFRYGPIINWICLFICGLPGGIDYYLLFAVKQRWISKIKEKQINRFLNMWIRLPGILSIVPFVYCCYIVGKYHVSKYLLLTHVLLNSINAIYFADRVTMNYALSKNLILK